MIEENHTHQPRMTRAQFPLYVGLPGAYRSGALCEPDRAEPLRRSLSRGARAESVRVDLRANLRRAPRDRLPRELIRLEINAILGLGVEMKLGKKSGRDFTLHDLKENGYEAIFLGIGWVSGRWRAG